MEKIYVSQEQQNFKYPGINLIKYTTIIMGKGRKFYKYMKHIHSKWRHAKLMKWKT